MHRAKWISFAATATLALVILIAVARGRNAGAQTNQPVWGLVAGIVPPTANLTTVFMVDRNNAWVGGSDAGSGQLFRLQYSDNAWHVIERQSFPQAILSLAAVTGDDVWVVGELGLIAHREPGNGWFRVDSPVPGATYNTIQMFGPGEGWIGGVLHTGSTYAPIALHYKDGTWQQDTTLQTRYPASGASVNSLHFNATIGYAVDSGEAWRYDDINTRWVEEELPHIPCLGGYQLNGVRTLSPDEAWAVGNFSCSGPPTNVHGIFLHRVNGSWQIGDRLGEQLNAVSFTSDGYGLAVGGLQNEMFTPDVCYVLSYHSDGQWHSENVPDMQGTLQSVSQADAQHALAVGTNGIILSYGYGPGSPVPTPTPTYTSEPTPTLTPVPTPLPSEPIPYPRNPALTYFPNVGHTLGGGFRNYWREHGGLAQFGYPITEEFREASPTDGKMYTVQYFERARFEWHPENRPPYDVLLGLLGRTITQGREGERPFRPASPSTNRGYIYFKPTAHNLASEFTQYWQTHGGLPVYGYPISEAFAEVSHTDGRLYLVQYFERNRFEYHPELPEAYRVSLGLLGVQVLKARGWLP